MLWAAHGGGILEGGEVDQSDGEHGERLVTPLRRLLILR